MNLALAARKLGYIPYYYALTLLSKYTRVRLAGTPIWEHDWEVLVILDACRYDVFADLYGDDDRFAVAATTSAGSASPEWMFNNFGADFAAEAADTAYVTANPYSARCIPEGRFAHRAEVWRDRWDDDAGTVLPEVLSDAAIRVWNEHDPGRMVVHYMQPHKPYVTAADSTPMAHDHFTFNLLKVFGARALGTYPDFKKAEARRGDIDDEELRRLYRENLAYAVDAIDRTLLRAVDADVVLSADHGELLGEDGIYHHPAYTRYDELRTVPWARVVDPPDGEYTPPDRTDDEPVSDGAVEERLRQLGYRG